MHVMVLGLRGFPGVMGGVETHAQQLYPELVKLGLDVTVIVRSCYQVYDGKSWEGVRFKRIWAPRSRSLEAIVHSVLGVLYAAWRRPDVLHVHAVGPSLVLPLARIAALRTVVTHHGPDYDREKWGRLARWLLRTGERFGMTLARERIVISPVIADLVRERYGRESSVIPNGVVIPEWPAGAMALEQFGLSPGRYVLLVSRFVPEKRHLDLIEAFESSALRDWRLVLVGGADHRGAYAHEVMDRVRKNERIVSTGFLTGSDLAEVFAHAGIFVLPSSHEGLPIALLEALSYGLRCLASDIPANLSVGLEPESYFALGDIGQLRERIGKLADRPWTDADRARLREWVARHYDWKKIAGQTATVLERAMKS